MAAQELVGPVRDPLPGQIDFTKDRIRIAIGAGLSQCLEGFPHVPEAQEGPDPLPCPARQIRVHGIPDFRLRTVIEHDNLREPSGVAVAHRGGESYAFVTDEKSLEVHVFKLPDGAYVRSFPHHLDKAEGISADDDWQRLYVSDDKSDDRGTKAFTFDGAEISEFVVARSLTDSLWTPS